MGTVKNVTLALRRRRRTCMHVLPSAFTCPPDVPSGRSAFRTWGYMSSPSYPGSAINPQRGASGGMSWKDTRADATMILRRGLNGSDRVDDVSLPRAYHGIDPCVCLRNEGSLLLITLTSTTPT